MWEASIGILLILAITLGIGALFAPAKRKTRARSHQDFKVSISVGNRFDQARTIKKHKEEQATVGTASQIPFDPPANKGSANTANAAESERAS